MVEICLCFDSRCLVYDATEWILYYLDAMDDESEQRKVDGKLEVLRKRRLAKYWVAFDPAHSCRLQLLAFSHAALANERSPFQALFNGHFRTATLEYRM
jgi:hypothetical protein